MIVVAIDPGTKNLGWCMMEGVEAMTIEDAGVDEIYNSQTPIMPHLTRGALEWFQNHQSMFIRADRILIEQQFTGPGKGLFTPLLVMQTLYAICLYHFPDKVQLISPSAVKKTFHIVGSYEQRKAQVVRMAGLQNLSGRVHDMADCVLMIEYDRQRNGRLLLEKERRELIEEKRRRIRQSIPVQRDQSPIRAPVPQRPSPESSPEPSSESDRTPSPQPEPRCKMCGDRLGARKYKSRVASGGHDCHKCYLRRRRNRN